MNISLLFHLGYSISYGQLYKASQKLAFCIAALTLIKATALEICKYDICFGINLCLLKLMYVRGRCNFHRFAKETRNRNCWSGNVVIKEKMFHQGYEIYNILVLLQFRYFLKFGINPYDSNSCHTFITNLLPKSWWKLFG